MKKSKLIDIFQVIKKEELRSLNEFICSPYFNKQLEVSQLCKYLIAVSRNGFSSKMLEEKRVFSVVFGQKPFDKKLLAHTMSKLSKLCETFIILKEFEQDAAAPQLYLMKAALQRNLEKSFNSAKRTASEQVNLDSLSSSNSYWQNYLLHQMKQDQFAQKDSRIADPFLQQTANTLDSFFYVQKLKLSSAMMARQRTLNEKYEINFIGEETQQELGQSALPPLLNLYYLTYTLLQKDNQEKELLHLFSLIFENAPNLSQEETRELINHTITYCALQIRKGYRNFTDHLLNIYQQGLATKILFDKEILSPWNYKNIVTLSLALKQYDWVEDFIENFTVHLPDLAQKDAFHYSMADLSYRKGNYDAAMEHLNKVEFSDIHYGIGAKVMLIKIYYENNENDALEALLASFKIYIMRNKLIGKEKKEIYLTFIRFTTYLYKGRKDLKEKINNTSLVNDKLWLLSQAEKTN